MQRRKFIKNAAMAAGAAFAMPYILPSGRLFAASGTRRAEHVVYVLFGGGVRQQESVLQRYLDDSQKINISGNILYNMMEGAAPQAKIVYGTDGFLKGDTPIPKILNSSLQKQGLLLPEVKALAPGHYSGLNGLLTGNALATQGLRQKPLLPTIFEYVRRHTGEPATKTWFVGNTIGNSVPLLNYSTHPEYGAKYGANFFAPNTTFGKPGIDNLSNAKVYNLKEELSHVYTMKNFLDNTFLNVGGTFDGIHNTEEDKEAIREFMRDVYSKKVTIPFPPVSSGDGATAGYALAIMERFKPRLTVLNFSDVDGCHGNFTGYLGSMHRADHAVGHIWNYINTKIPEMAGKTAMIVTPECGRNANPNPIIDQNDWYGFDHSDANTARVFSMMVGPDVPANLTIGSESNPIGISSDGVATIADILGIKNEVVNSGNLFGGTLSLYDRI